MTGSLLAQPGEEVVLRERRAGGVALADERLRTEGLGERLVGELQEERSLELAGVRRERGALLRRVRRCRRCTW